MSLHVPAGACIQVASVHVSPIHVPPVQRVLTFSESGRSRQSIILITTFITALSLSLASWATACRRNTVQASPWHTACEVLSLYRHCFRYSTLPPRAPDIKAHRVYF